MRYPIINGELPPMAAIHEYHIVTALGMVSCTFDDYELALKRFNEINNPTWKLVKVTRTLQEITPSMNTKSKTMMKLARELGLHIVDIPLSKTA